MLLAIVSVSLNALAQIFIKSLAGLEAELNFSLVRHWQFYAVAITYGISIATWFLALRSIPLHVAYPMQAGGYVLVSILAMVIFQERISNGSWIALGIIAIGVSMLALNSAK